MPHILRRRFWIETFLASATGVVAIVTLFWHDWIEIVFGADPDEGSGSTEWLVVAVLMIITLAFGVAARLEWRRARPAQSS
jgi:undecaprenyl pyrophosphate phosphatase UppP